MQQNGDAAVEFGDVGAGSAGGKRERSICKVDPVIFVQLPLVNCEENICNVVQRPHNFRSRVFPLTSDQFASKSLFLRPRWKKLWSGVLTRGAVVNFLSLHPSIQTRTQTKAGNPNGMSAARKWCHNKRQRTERPNRHCLTADESHGGSNLVKKMQTRLTGFGPDKFEWIVEVSFGIQKNGKSPNLFKLSRVAHYKRANLIKICIFNLGISEWKIFSLSRQSEGWNLNLKTKPRNAKVNLKLIK